MENEVKEKTFKEMLENYREYEANIRYYKRQLLKAQNKEISIGGGAGDGQPKAPKDSFKDDNTENQIIKKVDDENWYKYLISVLEADIDFIDSMINTLSFTHKQYIQNKYKYGFTVREVAEQAAKLENREVDEDNMKKVLQSITDKLENKYKKIKISPNTPLNLP